jgi:hypothetical protein
MAGDFWLFSSAKDFLTGPKENGPEKRHQVLALPSWKASRQNLG